VYSSLNSWIFYGSQLADFLGLIHAFLISISSFFILMNHVLRQIQTNEIIDLKLKFNAYLNRPFRIPFHLLHNDGPMRLLTGTVPLDNVTYDFPALPPPWAAPSLAGRRSERLPAGRQRTGGCACRRRGCRTPSAFPRAPGEAQSSRARRTPYVPAQSLPRTPTRKGSA
jgi:hypothetical protein